MENQKGLSTLTGIIIIIVAAIVILGGVFVYQNLVTQKAVKDLSAMDLLNSQTTSEFSTDSIYPLDIKNPIYSLSISADINLKSDKSLVRIILLDNKGTERLVYETYSLIADSNIFSVDNICGETCALDSVAPSSLKIQIVDATVNIKIVNFSDSLKKLSADIQTKGTALSTSEINKNRELSNITKLNTIIKEKGLTWVAGETSVSGLTYEQKKKLFTNPDGTPVSELPNLQGFEYYKGGIFTISTSSSLPPQEINVTVKTSKGFLNSILTTLASLYDSVVSIFYPQKSNPTPVILTAAITTPSSLPNSWDWRNVNGENWMTPVKNQGPIGSCAHFAALGTMEAQINLYYNQHLNLDLSEQTLVDCWLGGHPIKGPIPELAEPIPYNDMYSAIKSIGGIMDETCNPYANRLWDANNANCSYSYICSNWRERQWQLSSDNNPSYWYQSSCTSQGDISSGCTPNVNDFKSWLIKNGPVNAQINEWSHSVVLVGYRILKVGDWVVSSQIYPGDPLIGQTAWIIKNSWGADWGENGYFNFIFSPGSAVGGQIPIGPFVPPTNHSFWPAGFDGTVKCVDKDNDGYCNWGISDQPPAGTVCSSSCKKDTSNKYIKDCDDSNSKLGSFDTNLNCINIAPLTAVTVSVLPNPAVINKNVTFTATPMGGITPYTYSWSGACSGITSTCTKAFTTVGTYTATVKVKDALGKIVSVNASVVVVPVLVATVSVSPNQVIVKQKITFTAKVSGGTAPYTYSWPGTSCSSTSICTASISTAGIYVGVVRVTDAKGDIVTASSSSVTVNPPLSVTVFISPNPASVYRTVTFTATVDGGIAPYTYSWSMGCSSAIATCTKSFSSPATYKATVKVTDAKGNTVSISPTVTVK